MAPKSRREPVRSSASRLMAAIAAWQATADRVNVGGWRQADWLASGTANGGAGGQTWIDPAMAIRQDGHVRQVLLSANTVTGGNWKFKVFRYNSGTTNYDMVAESPAFTPTAGTYTLTLATPIAVQMGDIPGLYLPGPLNNEKLAISSTSRLILTRMAAGDVTTSDAFSTTYDTRLDMECRSNRPFLCVVGDSLTEGHCVGDAPLRWHGSLHDIADYTTSPGGNPTAEYANQVRDALGLGTQLQYQNYGLGGAHYSSVVSTGMSPALAAEPHTLVVMAGLNDIAVGKTWAADTEPALNLIRAMFTVSDSSRLMVCEVPPCNNLSDAESATRREWNANIAAWCAANGAYCIPISNPLAQLRKSTGELDDILTAYNLDGTHWTQAGVNTFAALVRAALAAPDTAAAKTAHTPYLLNFSGYTSWLSGDNMTQGREFSLSVDATCLGLRVKAYAAMGGCKIRLYRVSDQALIASQDGLYVGAGENELLFSTPVKLTAGTLYRLANYQVNSPNNRFAMRNSSVDHPDGAVVTLTSVVYRYVSGDAYPDTSVANRSYAGEPIIVT